MSLLRLQNRTPSYYCSESRDFQLLCRLYDNTVNAILYDVDTIPSILSTRNCRNTVLPLLQTKLGFFTEKEFNNVALRYVLESFPSLVKKKGALKAFEESLNAFIKINNILSPITIYFSKEPLTLYNKFTIPDHSLLIGINTGFEDTSILDEIFKYIVPVGIGYYFYFYTQVSAKTQQYIKDNAKLIFVSHNINSQLRDSNQLSRGLSNAIPFYTDSMDNRLTGAVDTINLATTDTIIPIKSLSIPNESLFIGQYETETTFSSLLSELGITAQDGSTIVYNGYQVTYIEDNWYVMYFIGNVSDKDTDSTVVPTGLVDSLTTIKVTYDVSEEKFYMYNSSWVECNYPLFLFPNTSYGRTEYIDNNEGE